MKQIIFTLCIMITGVAQAQETPVLFISEKLCIVYIDGTQKGTVSNDAPLLLKLSYGEHYFEAKNDNDKISNVITCQDNKQKVVQIKFAYGNPASENVQTDATKAPMLYSTSNTLLNYDVKLQGLKIGKEKTSQQFFLAFDAGDTITIKSGKIGESGTNNVYVYNYPENQQIFFKEKMDNNAEMRFIVPYKAVYRIDLNTNYFFDKTSHISMIRQPASGSSNNFNTTPFIKNDTTFIQLNDINEKIVTTGFTRKISLPQGTKYWVYWIGLGNEAKLKYETIRETLNTNPLQLYGTGKLSSLASYNSNKTMQYYFMDNGNANLFLSGSPFKYYTFKSGSYLTTDYAVINDRPKELNIAVSANKMVGEFVYMRIGAFVVKSSYSLAE